MLLVVCSKNTKIIELSTQITIVFQQLHKMHYGLLVDFIVTSLILSVDR